MLTKEQEDKLAECQMEINRLANNKIPLPDKDSPYYEVTKQWNEGIDAQINYTLELMREIADVNT